MPELKLAMESAVVRYDGTVRTSNNNIIQFRYGEGEFSFYIVKPNKATTE